MVASHMRWTVLFTVCGLQAGAAEADASRREHHAHEHGIATLEVALDGSQLSIAFEAPALDLLGFERPPRSAKEIAAAESVEKILRNAAALFTTPASAACKLTEADARMPDWSRGASHYEYQGRYLYECQAPDALTHIDVPLTSKLAAATRLRAQVVTPRVQRVTELKRNNTRLALQ